MKRINSLSLIDFFNRQNPIEKENFLSVLTPTKRAALDNVLGGGNEQPKFFYFDDSELEAIKEIAITPFWEQFEQGLEEYEK